MVKFAERLEDAKQSEWAAYYVDYDRLKLLLRLIVRAAERPNANAPCGASNFDIDGGFGLLEPTPVLAPHLGSEAQRRLIAVLDCDAAPRLPRPASATALGSLGVLAGSAPSLALLLAAGEEEDGGACHWTRWLFSPAPGDAYDVLAAGFDVACVAELRKVQRHYTRELALLEERWAHHLCEHVAAPRRGSRGSYAAVAADEPGGPRRRASTADAEPTDRASRESLKRALAQLDFDARKLVAGGVPRCFWEKQTPRTQVDYTVWNYSAFVKITKKRDKLLKREPKIRERFCEGVRHRDCWSAAKARALADDVKASYAAAFYDGDEAIAERGLRDDHVVLHTTHGGYDADALRLGYRCGAAAVLAAWLLWDCFEVVASGADVDGWRRSVAAAPAWPVFRGLGCLLAWHWLWGASLHVWARYRVNVEFLFDADPRVAATHLDVYAEASVETVVLLALLLIYYKSTYAYGVPGRRSAPRLAAGVPLAAAIFGAWRLVFPWKRRRQLWAALGRVVLAPFREVRFVDTFVADVLTSMVKVLLDVLWTVCFFLSGDVVAAAASEDDAVFAPTWARSRFATRVLTPTCCLLPVLWRFLQCLRKYNDSGASPRRWLQLANATKYALSLFVSLFSALNVGGGGGGGSVFAAQPFWFAVFVGSSLYSWCWDVFVDWGLAPYADGEVLSRPRRLYPAAWWYRCAAAADSVGRFVWLAQILPPSDTSRRIDAIVPDFFVPLLALAELARRSAWSCFRLEHEHVSNAFGHRSEQQFVPSHFRRRAVSQAPKRVQSGVEALLIVGLVSLLLAKIATSSTAVGHARESLHRPSPEPSRAPI